MATATAFYPLFLSAQQCIRCGTFVDMQPGHSLVINHLAQVVCLAFMFSIV
jgi:hypothetical protein